ncbi:MAG: helix-turn-helix domain-containing protein [Planctomycetota bacterium]
MDDTYTSIHLAERCAGGLPRVFGCYREQVRTGKQAYRASSLNFSCILSGSGWYRQAGRTYRVQAPALFRQWPGVTLGYGPDLQWREHSLIYLGEEAEALQVAGVLPWPWPVRQLDAAAGTRLRALWAMLEELCAQTALVGSQIDALALSILLVARGEGAAVPAGVHALERVHEQLAVLDRAVPRLDDLAARCGWSAATLRRRWQAAYGCPPLEYAFRLKTRRACELLAGSDLPIRAVAAAVGFQDQLYFSKWFARRSGLAPSVYRARHRP